MQITVTRNFGPLTDAATLTEADWRRVGLLARERIITRTVAEGRDEHGQPFAPYSPAYAAEKLKAGASYRVDLQLSGAMLQAITVTPDAQGVTLGFIR